MWPPRARIAPPRHSLPGRESPMGRGAFSISRARLGGRFRVAAHRERRRIRPSGGVVPLDREPIQNLWDRTRLERDRRIDGDQKGTRRSDHRGRIDQIDPVGSVETARGRECRAEVSSPRSVAKSSLRFRVRPRRRRKTLRSSYGNDGSATTNDSLTTTH